MELRLWTILTAPWLVAGLIPACSAFLYPKTGSAGRQMGRIQGGGREIMKSQTSSAHPLLYQINTRVWLTELSTSLGRPATLDDIPDAELDRLAKMGFDWVWFLSVWQTVRRASESHASILNGEENFRRPCRICVRRILPDLDSPSPATPSIPSWEAMRRWRGCANASANAVSSSCSTSFPITRGSITHGWKSIPSITFAGTEHDLAHAPHNYTWVKRKAGDSILAYGRDPYFSGWPDTLQLNYGNPATQEAMIGELLKIAGQCDGVRCDMAMLVLPDVFERTWGLQAELFWPKATRTSAQTISKLPVHG